MLYEPLVRQVLDTLDQGKIPIVYGARGSGKSLQVVARAAHQLDDRDDVSVMIRSMQSIIHSPDPVGLIVETVPKRFDPRSSRKILFLDEAQSLVSFAAQSDEAEPPAGLADTARLSKLITWALDNKVQLGLVNAAVNDAERQEVNQKLIEALAREGALEGVPILVDVQIPPAFATDYLQRHGANQELIDFANKPENAGALRVRAFDYLFVAGHIRDLSHLQSYFSNGELAMGFIHGMAVLGHKQELMSLLANITMPAVYRQELDRTLENTEYDIN